MTISVKPATDAATWPAARTSLVAGVLFVAIVLLLKLVSPNVGWAVADSRRYHFVVINYFIEHGFDWDYPPVLAMFPGLHAYFAEVARLLGLGPLAFDGWAAFLIQAVWGIAYIAVLMLLFERTRIAGRTDPALLVPMLCSSYPIFSWLWPTTDIGAYACLFGMILVTWDTREISVGKVALFTLLALLATLLRQNYAALSAGLFASIVLQDPGNARHRLGALAAALIPVAANACLLGLFLYLWGDVVPPELAHHGTVKGIHLVPIAHILALTGLIAWPFALLAVKALRPDRGTLAAILFASMALAILSLLFLPMSYDRGAGRWGSLIWTFAQKTQGTGIDLLFLFATLTVGAAIWISVLLVCWRERAMPAEVVICGLFVASFVFQAEAWQRYVEVILLVTLTIFFGRRVPLTGRLRWVVVGWFGLYAALTVCKAAFGLGNGS